MAQAAPPFLAPPEVMNAIHPDPYVDAEEHMVDQPAADHMVEELAGDHVVKQPASNEFLDVLKMAMPPGNESTPLVSHDSQGNLMGLTENLSATYMSSGSACLDFFFQVVPSTEKDQLVLLLEKAWEEDPLKALKLVFHLRGVRDTGKSDKERFYYAAIWLQEHHPATLLENLELIAEFGYIKDLLEVVLRLVEGPEETERRVEAKAARKKVADVRRTNKAKWKAHHGKSEGGNESESDGDNESESDDDDDDTVPKPKKFRQVPTGGYYQRKGANARKAKAAGTLQPKEQRIAASMEADRSAKEKAAELRKQKKFEFPLKVAKVYFNDSKFRALYLQVAKSFADRLTKDLKALDEGRVFDIGLAAKWAPSLGNSYDRRTLLCYSIATLMFPKQRYPEYLGLDDQKYRLAVREKLRKQVLVPLRKALELPEVYMSARKWGEVNYKRVASVAMKNYKQHFLKHDNERFTTLIERVKEGKEKVAAGALLPHEIIRDAIQDDGVLADVSELQWKQMVTDLKEKGSLSDCLAVCDVSGSMSGEPMEVCIALGILLSDLSELPWKGHVITFSHAPEIHVITGNSLKEKYEFTLRMDWGTNTNFQLVFDKLLTMAKLHNLAPEKMIKRLFVFSDMEFDQASGVPWETDYFAICSKFQEAGYGTPPDLVFWNLRSSNSIPVLKSQAGVALVSGFSKNLLKIFLKGNGTIDPISIMEDAISGEEYIKVKIVD